MVEGTISTERSRRLPQGISGLIIRFSLTEFRSGDFSRLRQSDGGTGGTHKGGPVALPDVSSSAPGHDAVSHSRDVSTAQPGHGRTRLVCRIWPRRRSSASFLSTGGGSEGARQIDQQHSEAPRRIRDFGEGQPDQRANEPRDRLHHEDDGRRADRPKPREMLERVENAAAGAIIYAVRLDLVGRGAPLVIGDRLG